MRSRLVVLFFAFGSAALAAACASTKDVAHGSEPSPTYVPPETAAGPEEEQLHHGERLYAFACEDCHGANGEGTSNIPRIVPISSAPLPGARIRKDAFHSAADVEAFVRGHMPAGFVGLLEPNAYWDVTAYVLRKGGVAFHGNVLNATSAPEIALP